MSTASLTEMVAKDKVGRPDATWLKLEALSVEHDGIDAHRVTLADVPNYVRGPKTGKPNYRAATNQQLVFVLPDEVAAWLQAHPEMCGTCTNEREVFVSWSAADGTVTRPCSTCSAAPPSPVEENATGGAS